MLGEVLRGHAIGRCLLMPAGNVMTDRRRTARGWFCLAGKTAAFVTHSFPFFTLLQFRVHTEDAVS